MNIFLLYPDQISKINQDTTVTLTQSQSQHLKTVLKPNAHDTLKIGKLNGNLGTARIMEMTGDKVVLDNICLDTPPPAKLDVTVVLALPRPKVLRRLIMDMTALGVNHIVIINSYRTDKSYWGSPLLAKIDDYIYEGLQQGVDTIAPKVTLAKRFKPFVEDDLPNIAGDKVVFHPYADVSFGQYCANHSLPKVIIIGAEGGFIDYEIKLLQSIGVTAATLGNRILRSESAVNAVLGRWLAD